LVGPIIGAIFVNAGKSWFTGVLPEFWLFALGGLFIFVTLFLPNGILGLFDRFRRRPTPGQGKVEIASQPAE
jgi:urea transport system permease protein